MCLSRPPATNSRQTLDVWLGRQGDYKHKNIDPCGDPIQERSEDDGVLRMGYQNIHGTSMGNGLEIAEEIEVMNDLGVDIQGMSEINRPWSPNNKWQYNMMMKMMFDTSHTVFSAAKTTHDRNYQPGGNLLTVTGRHTGRVLKSGSDRWGRFCWTTMQGKRDEGIIVINLYRVCHEKGDNPGPFTAFNQQYSAMRAEGLKDPNPRKQILKDVLLLIQQKRTEGFRPILMMDANGDYTHEKDPDLDLAKFIEEAQLVDQFKKKFPGKTRTFMYGSKRLDYILFDPSLVEAIKSIGYLGTHEGSYSDHVYAYVDFWENKLFQGVTNHPIPLHAREFQIEQADKKVKFVDEVKKRFEAQRVRERVFELARLFAQFGATTKIRTKYQTLDRQIRESATGAASKVGKRKFGYMRSPEIQMCGRILVLYKMIMDTQMRNAPISPALQLRADKLSVNLSIIHEKTHAQLRREVRRRRKDLWEAQKTCESDRAEWLQGAAKERAKAAGDLEWEKRLKQMKEVAESRATNRKLSAITKGRHGQLDSVQTCTHDWFYSPKANELYHYTQGNFEAYPQYRGDKYYSHHTLKVPPPDSRLALVTTDEDGTHTLTLVIEWFLSQSGTLYHMTRDDGIHNYYRTPRGTYCLGTTRDSIPTEAKAVTVTNATIAGEVKLEREFSFTSTVWKDTNEAVKVESTILKRNKRHLQQMTVEGGRCNQEPMTTLHRNHGINSDVDGLLAGKKTFDYEVTEEMAAWMEAVKQTPTEISATPIVGCIPMHAYQEMFKKATESTSSNSTWGLHYTIWKAMAEDDYCAEFLCIMISLPFMYGFPNMRWLKEIDVMLEKKKGIRMIHMLRIIGLLEADFNTALKYFFSVRMQPQAELTGLSDEQWGSRRDRTSIDATMLKLLQYENARVMKSAMGEINHDCKACFDRMHPSQSNIYAQKKGMDKNLLKARAICIERMRRHAKTGLGVSVETYGNEEGEPFLGGEVQGKGDVPSLFMIQSSVLLSAHASIAPGLRMDSCTKNRSIHRHNAGYVDDNDGHVSAPHDTLLEEQEGMIKECLQRSGQIWSNLFDISGGSLALHKINWRMIAWELIKGELKLVKATEEILVLEDGHGAYSVIDFQPPDQPNVGLGYRLCPDGNQKHQHKAIRESVSALCKKTASAYLTEKEAKQVLYQRLDPKLSYTLHLSSFDQPQCDKLNTLIRKSFLPPMKLNRHLPAAVLYGPQEYGGMEFPECYTMQDQLQLPYLVKQLRWDETVANDSRSFFENLQLASGFIRPVFEATDLPILFVDKGFHTQAHKRMGEIGAQIWIENYWVPQLQRVGDESIMERFCRIPRITTRELEKINQVRLFLRVITIADLTDPKGTTIMDGMLDGSFQAGSDFMWPNQPMPPKSFWTLFRRCLRLTFCTRAPPYQRAHHSMELDVPLGKWLSVPRNTWWECYRTETSIIYRENEGSVLQEFTHHKAGFYQYSGEIEMLPVDSHPFTCQRFGERLWTRKHYRSEKPTHKDPNSLPPGHTIYNTLDEDYTGKMTNGSDGSVHLIHTTAAAAWIATSDADHQMAACFLMADINTVSSYRSELEGIFRCLKHVDYLSLTPSSIEHWCDNEQSVKSTQCPPSNPTSMIAADADIVLAIHNIKKTLKIPVHCRHVYGHQDSKKKKEKETKAAKNKQAKQINPIDTKKCIAPTAVAAQFHKAPTLPNLPTHMMHNPQQEDHMVHITEDTDSDSEPDSDCDSEPEEPTTKPKKPLATSALINIGCDEHASKVTELALSGEINDPGPALTLPYPGSQAMLKIGDKWVTSKYKRTIYKARRVGPMRTYCDESYKWTNNQFDDVDWNAVGRVRKKLTTSRFRQTCKVMHGWLPVMHMRFTGITQCPGCSCPDEKIDHVFQCPNPQIEKQRLEILSALRKKGVEEKLPRDAVRLFVDIVTHAFSGSDQFDHTRYNGRTQKVTRAQESIGFNLFLRGFLTNEWFHYFTFLEVSNPERRVDTLLRIIWDEIFDPIWNRRNRILHDEKNKYNTAEDKELTEKITWYVQHREEVLAYHDHFLAKHDLTTLSTMRRETKRRWIKHLDRAKLAYTVEQTQRASDQNVITRYFTTRQQTDNSSSHTIEGTDMNTQSHNTN